MQHNAPRSPAATDSMAADAHHGAPRPPTTQHAALVMPAAAVETQHAPPRASAAPGTSAATSRNSTSARAATGSDRGRARSVAPKRQRRKRQPSSANFQAVVEAVPAPMCQRKGREEAPPPPSL
nr:unnamed protein product [Digitaria exilis]